MKNHDGNNYYLGALTVKKRADNDFEVIDGQQRLTTLFLILSVLNHSFESNLSFEHRQNSSDELNIIKQQSELNSDSQIAKVYSYLIKNKDSLFDIKDGNADDYWQAIWKNVQIMQVELPDNADLNQYFERMNNRGEQLEQHEVIKAKLMSKLDIDDRAVFSAIWNACSDMSRYAVSSFEPKLRDALFFPNDKIDESGKKIDEGEYFAFYQLDEFDKLRDKYKTVYSKKTDDKSQENQESIESSGTVSTENMPTLENILQKKKIIFNSDDNQKGDGERFTSIIDFPNFLAQVLYLFLKDKHCINADIHRLDAGNLNKQFDEAGLYGNEDRIKKFGVHLLNTRLLFDRYVIKHDGHESKDDWCIYTYQWLKKDKKNDFRNTFDKENSKIIMLQTMFHYSFPARNYKYWLFAYLKWLNDESRKKLEKHEADGCAFKLPANEHIKFLEQLCDKFYFNRFYQNDFSKEYFDIIYNQEVLVLNLSHDDKRCAFLNTGTAVENFIFNRLDYILWRKQGRWCWRNDENFKTGVDLSKFLKEFKFTSRNSVEHYYPQNPINGEKLSDNDDENGKILNNFGNLCLINHSQNSSLSNRMPDEKKSGYKDNVARHQSVSIKQLLMFTYKVWDKNTIQEHGEKMIQLLNEKIST
ncbi:DUF262 domain-containing protein [Moraxella bovis]|uniref:DUF262 domain-containing HNH endonuclease family protein n=1 Tax=Moraxella bovis TaxID=476 RepID=A0ABY6MAS4_MORBO|nr:DUF262 domain-containing HNH endonuclease family protein [Moraxella bovis]UYZ76976.1 DUF262 domain-containing HNH endonuclease family protein [Moraxella bovis]UYZ79681.1 DUF262 domain-containing HNH endonuclease family protein [Moraxella bovis]UYZ88168.1 DUF262 domain-containing HNH endonuclease family protein [Moraxella bovis]UYZ99091.1 DUF262 domain-containing HNH endonuclease family protein [Moraxella bovis]UZA01758.1 DUF262 domain-containing HNH endonuclease family protein [Moraxella bo